MTYAHSHAVAATIGMLMHALCCSSCATHGHMASGESIPLCQPLAYKNRVLETVNLSRTSVSRPEGLRLYRVRKFRPTSGFLPTYKALGYVLNFLLEGNTSLPVVRYNILMENWFPSWREISRVLSCIDITNSFQTWAFSIWKLSSTRRMCRS